MAVGMVMKLSEPVAQTLTSVATRTSAQRILFAKIVPETIPVNVKPASKDIFVRIQMSVPSVAVIQTPNASIPTAATLALAMLASTVTDKLVRKDSVMIDVVL